MVRKLPIGIQGFESLRRNCYLYVDKTKYIYELAHTGKQFFLSRPRRFGKSLFLSTLRAYWEGKKELFEGLDIVRLEENDPNAWQPHPVFYFDFNGANYSESTALETVLDIHLKRWEKQYEIQSVGVSLEERFQNLLIRANKKTGLGSVVLVDEYDKSLLEAPHNPVLEEHNKAVFKGFFGTLKSFDEYLQFVFITGVTKFSKVSIFSDLNQLNDISLSQKYTSICGVTEEELLTNFRTEIEELAKSQELTEEECLAKLRKTYDGYHFHPKAAGVYNPFSLLKAFFDKNFGSYWFATGTPSFLVKQIQQSRFDIQKFTDGMLYSNEKALSDYRIDNPDLVPLLYQSGYLTIVGYDARKQRFTMGFPNEEVKYGFLDSLLPAYAPESAANSGKDIYTLDDYIEAGNLDGVRDILTALFASIPYASAQNPFEHYFQSVIYLVFTLLGKLTKCEVHSSQGRADCILETNDYVYIFEFKLDKSAEEALAQIEEKQYPLPYAADARKLFKIGVNFNSETKNIDGWKVKECKRKIITRL